MQFAEFFINFVGVLCSAVLSLGMSKHKQWYLFEYLVLSDPVLRPVYSDATLRRVELSCVAISVKLILISVLLLLCMKQLWIRSAELSSSAAEYAV